ncbi:MAG: TonB-dependent receptor [Bacteroidota bacterium]|nr:TonB-dependent receptor [Bacteroidota bacterium]
MRNSLLLLFSISGFWLSGQDCFFHLKAISDGESLPNALIEWENQIIGSTGMDGHFYYEGPCRSGSITIRASGFIPRIMDPELRSKDMQTVNLQPDPLMLNEVVISGTRTDRRRIDNPVAVNVLDRKTLVITQSNSLADGICFQPGLRVETDCQTCNYTQVRMNGLGGSYSQILIDSRPIFTSLMSLYGLEIVPSEQIERVEVVRGGGSALFGANAIAGTINIITRTPEKNGFGIQYSPSLIGGSAMDQVWTGHGTLVTTDRKFGLTVTGNHRERDPFDANDDGYSEIPEIMNNSLGLNSFWRPNKHHKVHLSTWRLHEYRRGGNRFDLPADQADQSEERTHDIWAGTVDYSFTPSDLPFEVTAYFGGQHTLRDHYTGIEQSPGWGNTVSSSLMGGIQLDHTMMIGNSINRLTFGAETQWEDTYDAIPAYQYLIDQTTRMDGIFLQSDWDLDQRWTLLSGLRYNQHNLVESGIFTPRMGLLFKPTQKWQIRGSWSQGFKPPQAFETDMHIAFAGGGISYIRIDPNLKAEHSNSFNLSVDANFPTPRYIWGFTVDGFLTRLVDPFILEEGPSDDEGNQVLIRKNGPTATVAGITLETRGNYNRIIQVDAGVTLQIAEYESPIAWSADIKTEKSFLRTPETYGFMTLQIFPENNLNGSLSSVFTGPMKVPHFAGAPEQPYDELILSRSFLEINLRVAYRQRIPNTPLTWEIFGGVQNLLNAYQSDFDTGRFRDSNYIYGPSRPRTIFLGLRVSGQD